MRKGIVPIGRKIKPIFHSFLLQYSFPHVHEDREGERFPKEMDDGITLITVVVRYPFVLGI